MSATTASSASALVGSASSLPSLSSTPKETHSLVNAVNASVALPDAAIPLGPETPTKRPMEHVDDKPGKAAKKQVKKLSKHAKSAQRGGNSRGTESKAKKEHSPGKKEKREKESEGKQKNEGKREKDSEGKQNNEGKREKDSEGKQKKESEGKREKDSEGKQKKDSEVKRSPGKKRGEKRGDKEQEKRDGEKHKEKLKLPEEKSKARPGAARPVGWRSEKAFEKHKQRLKRAESKTLAQSPKSPTRRKHGSFDDKEEKEKEKAKERDKEEGEVVGEDVTKGDARGKEARPDRSDAKHKQDNKQDGGEAVTPRKGRPSLKGKKLDAGGSKTASSAEQGDAERGIVKVMVAEIERKGSTKERVSITVKGERAEAGKPRVRKPPSKESSGDGKSARADRADRDGVEGVGGQEKAGSERMPAHLDKRNSVADSTRPTGANLATDQLQQPNLQQAHPHEQHPPHPQQLPQGKYRMECDKLDVVPQSSVAGMKTAIRMMIKALAPMAVGVSEFPPFFSSAAPALGARSPTLPSPAPIRTQLLGPLAQAVLDGCVCRGGFPVGVQIDGVELILMLLRLSPSVCLHLLQRNAAVTLVEMALTELNLLHDGFSKIELSTETPSEVTDYQSDTLSLDESCSPPSSVGAASPSSTLSSTAAPSSPSLSPSSSSLSPASSSTSASSTSREKSSAKHQQEQSSPTATLDPTSTATSTATTGTKPTKTTVTTSTSKRRRLRKRNSLRRSPDSSPSSRLRRAAGGGLHTVDSVKTNLTKLKKIRESVRSRVGNDKGKTRARRNHVAGKCDEKRQPAKDKGRKPAEATSTTGEDVQQKEGEAAKLEEEEQHVERWRHARRLLPHLFHLLTALLSQPQTLDIAHKINYRVVRLAGLTGLLHRISLFFHTCETQGKLNPNLATTIDPSSQSNSPNSSSSPTASSSSASSRRQQRKRTKAASESPKPVWELKMCLRMVQLLQAISCYGECGSASSPVWKRSPAKQHAPTLLKVIEETGGMGLVSLICACTLPRGKLTERVVFQPLAIPIVLHAFKVLNNAARLDLTLMQRLLSHSSLQLYHALSITLPSAVWHHTQGSVAYGCPPPPRDTQRGHHGIVPCVPSADADYAPKALLSEVILFIGYYALQNPQTQATFRYGQSPTLLQRLCTLPETFFSEQGAKALLLPTLIALSFASEANQAVMAGDLDPQLLVDFIKAQQRLQDAARGKHQQSSNSSSVYALNQRFPWRLWSEAIVFYSVSSTRSERDSSVPL